MPREVNKADAVALVGAFGSLRNAVNAGPEVVGVVGGWGGKKVKAWCRAVEEPFRVRKAGRRGVVSGGVKKVVGGEGGGGDEEAEAAVEEAEAAVAEAEAEVVEGRGPEPVRAAPVVPAVSARGDEKLSDGVAAALARLREKG